MIKEFYDNLESNYGSDVKIHNYNNIDKNMTELIFEFFEKTHSNIIFDIKEGVITKVNLEHKYSDKNLIKNNKFLLLNTLKYILSPNKLTNLYHNYYLKEEETFVDDEKKLTKDFLNKLFSSEKEFNPDYFCILPEVEISFYNETHKKENDENVFYLKSVYQPSFEFLYKASTEIELIDFIEFKLVSNQVEKDRNVFTKVIFPSVTGNRISIRDSHLIPTSKNLIKNIYNISNKNFQINIDVIVHLKRKLDFQEEMVFRDYFEKNGLILTKNDIKTPKSVANFDLIMLLSSLKV